MSFVPVTDAQGNTRKIDSVQRVDGADTIETPAGILLDPAGAAVDPSTKALQQALNLIASACQAALESINAKTPMSVGGATPVTADDLSFVLRQVLAAIAQPPTYDASTQSTQVRLAANQTLANVTTVAGVTAVTTVSTVSSLSNVAAIDGLQPRIQIYADDQSAWAACVRARIT